MSDCDFEQRLVDRIAARELIAAQLSPRQRRVLGDWLRTDGTEDEIGKRFNLSRGRINQIIKRSIDTLRRAHEKSYDTFDRSAFESHMDLLVRLRQAEAERQARNAEDWTPEECDAAPPPPPPARYTPIDWTTPQPPKRPPVVYSMFSAPFDLWSLAQSPSVEPWFDPARMPTPSDMAQIANYAIGLFIAHRNLHNIRGKDQTFARCFKLQCRRDADAIASTLAPIARGLPPGTQFSTEAPPLGGALGASVELPQLAMTVTSKAAGKDVVLGFYWEPSA